MKRPQPPAPSPSSAYLAVCILPDGSQVTIPFQFDLNFSGVLSQDTKEVAFMFFANFSKHPAAQINDDPQGRGLQHGLRAVLHAKETLLIAIDVLL